LIDRHPRRKTRQEEGAAEAAEGSVAVLHIVEVDGPLGLPQVGPGTIFRQGVSYGKHNVLIYSRYKDRGMPRLGWLPGLLRWAKLLLKTPLLLLTREGRSRWLWQLGWRIGRIEGCFEYKVVAP
jgi:hypothetical protein